MSVMRCESCDAFIDTDYYVEGFTDDDRFYCESCLELIYTICDGCGELVRREDLTHGKEQHEQTPDSGSDTIALCPKCAHA